MIHSSPSWNWTFISHTWQFRKIKKWQPLMESDGLGYISTQEHVTPHIGSTGRFLGFSSEEEEKAYSSRTLSKPDYINRYRRK